MGRPLGERPLREVKPGRNRQADRHPYGPADAPEHPRRQARRSPRRPRPAHRRGRWLADARGALRPQDPRGLRPAAGRRVHGPGPHPRRRRPDRAGCAAWPGSPPATPRTGCTSPPARTSSSTGSAPARWKRVLAASTRHGPVHPVGVRPHAAQRHVLQDAGVGLDEPFDCLPDARLVSRHHRRPARRSSTSSCRAGSTSRSVARRAAGTTPWSTTSGSSRSCVDGVPGYEIWAGGSLGKAPSLAVLLGPFVPRDRRARRRRGARRGLRRRTVASTSPAKGRMKFVVERHRRRRASAPPGRQPSTEPGAEPRPAVAAGRRARRGRSAGDPRRGTARAAGASACGPQRTPGLASVTIDLPLGDTSGSELELCCDLADRHADGHLDPHPRPEPDVPQRPARGGGRRSATPSAERGLFLLGEGATAQIRACTGSAVCALGITDSPGAGQRLAANAALASQLGAAGVRVRLPELVRPAPDRRHRAGRIEGPRRRPDHRRLPGVPRAPTSIATARARSSAGWPRPTSTPPSTRSSAPGRRSATTASRSARDRAPPRPRRLRRPDRRGPRRPLGARARARPRPRRLHSA